MYEALASGSRNDKAYNVSDPLFITHVDAAYKLVLSFKKKHIIPRAYTWLESLITLAPVGFFKSQFEEISKPINLVK